MRHAAQLHAPLFALALAMGCASESYYCDETGCFYCDGLGCREVEPPQRPTCRGDFECAEGSLCTDLGCVATCDGDGDCIEGTACRADQCVGPTEPEPEPTPGTCDRNVDCGDPSLVCRDGMCTPDDRSCGDAGCDCTETGMCGEGFLCVAGECRAEDDVCRFNTECGEGRVCVDGRCLTSGCTGESPCPTGQTCEAGICRVIPPNVGECDSATPCGAGFVCVDGACREGCEGESCGAGRYCDSGTCRVDDRPRPFCVNDSDCRFACINGRCRTPCTDSRECAMVDVQFNFCLDDFCATTNEATSNCATSTDCEGAEECVDGICR